MGTVCDHGSSRLPSWEDVSKGSESQPHTDVSAIGKNVNHRLVLHIVVALQVVSEKELANTYGSEGGWPTVKQYREATDLREKNPEMSRAEISRRVKRPQSAVRGWLAEDKTPRVIKGLTYAHEHGWIDIDPDSEQFRAINQLVAWIFSGGGLTQETFVPTFSVDDHLTLATLDILLRWINVEYRLRDPETSYSSYEVIPSEGASVLGRVLHVLDAPRGVKAEQRDLTLPSYLKEAGDAHKRDFARIYLLNRGSDLATSGTAGSNVYAMSSPEFARELQRFFTSISAGSVTLGKHNQLWISAESIQDLAGGNPLRPAMAINAAFGSLTPPTERAFASTYRQNESLGGYRRAQLYDEIRESDQSRQELAKEYSNLTQSTIQSWRRGHKPYSKNGLVEAHNQGWITPSPDSNTVLGLTTLLAWVTIQGSLRSKTYYPMFLVKSEDEKACLKSTAEDVGITLQPVREETREQRPIEMRPPKWGAVLGRVLFSLGAPLSDREQFLLPSYLYYYPSHAEQFVLTWCQLTGEKEANTFIIEIPMRFGSHFVHAFEYLVEKVLQWPVHRNSDREFHINYTPDD